MPIAVGYWAFGHHLQDWERQQMFFIAKLYLIFGLPIALLLSAVIGFPIWERAELRGRRSSRDAIISGMIVGISIGIFHTHIRADGSAYVPQRELQQQ